MKQMMSELINSALNNVDHSQGEDAVKNHLEDLLQALAAVIGQVKVETYPVDTKLCTQGANEETFYIIAKGEVDVIIQTEEMRKKVASKSAGDFFGEMALILDAPRSADVITTSPSIVLELDRRSFKRATRISDQLAGLLSERTMEQLEANRRQTQELARVELPPYRIFASYSRQNQEFVRKLIADLHASLTTSNISLWFDQVDIPIGQKWDRAVEEALETCDAMLLVLSSASSESENVRDEWMYYKSAEKPIIPVLFEKCKKPFQLSRYQHVDFVEQPYASALAQVHLRLLELSDSA